MRCLSIGYRNLISAAQYNKNKIAKAIVKVRFNQILNDRQDACCKMIIERHKFA